MIAPRTSAPRPRPIPRSVWSRRIASTAVMIPIGRLTKKIQCQLTAAVMRPPARRPTAAPADAMKLNTPNAFARSSGSGNSVTTMARITAELTAPPMPWMNRAAISIGCVNESPHSIDAAVKSRRPARKTRLRPTRSPTRPASKSSPPNAIRYALMTHARPDCEKPRSFWIDGSATFTIVMSTTINRNPVHRTSSESQREFFMLIQTTNLPMTHRFATDELSPAIPSEYRWRPGRSS